MGRRILQMLKGDPALNEFKAEIRDFKRIVRNEAIHWDRVMRVTPAGFEPVFGLVVPGNELFMIQNGLFLQAASDGSRETGGVLLAR